MAQYLDIIVLLVVVILIFQKLKSLLGTRPDESEHKLNEEKAAKLFDLIVQETEKKNKPQPVAEIQTVHKEETPAAETSELSETDKTLAQIPGFDKNKFLNSAKKAFELIVTSFSKGDMETLEMLVSKNLAKKFQEILNQRQSEGITAETDFIGFDSAEITGAKISKSNLAKITVKFISEQVNILKNKKGEIIEGDDQYIQNITDVWTFERALTSTSPNWLLVSTKK